MSKLKFLVRSFFNLIKQRQIRLALAYSLLFFKRRLPVNSNFLNVSFLFPKRHANSVVFNPKISVVITDHNMYEFMHNCINSVRNQSYTNYEIIVVLSSSNAKLRQATLNLLEKFNRSDNPKIRLVETPPQNVSRNRNLGLKIATGDFVFFLDPDDRLLPNCLDILALYAYLEQADVVAPSSFLIRESEVTKTWIVKRKITLGSLRLFNQLPNCSLIRIKKFDEINGYKEFSYPVHEDWALFLELSLNGATIVGVQQPLVEILERSNSLSRSSNHGSMERQSKIINEHLKTTRIQIIHSWYRSKQNVEIHFNEYEGARKSRIFILLNYDFINGTRRLAERARDELCAAGFDVIICVRHATNPTDAESFIPGAYYLHGLNHREILRFFKAICRQKNYLWSIDDPIIYEVAKSNQSSRSFFLDSIFVEGSYQHRKSQRAKNIDATVIESLSAAKLVRNNRKYLVTKRDSVPKSNFKKTKSLKLRVGFLGRLEPEKSVSTFLSIANSKNLSKTHTFVIAGYGSQETLVLEAARKNTNLKFEGKVLDVEKFFQSIDILILPSIWEGLPNVVSESLSYGTPVLARDVGYIIDLVKTGKNGVLINANEERFVMESIRILGDRPFLDHLRKGLKEPGSHSNSYEFQDISEDFRKFLLTQ